MTGYSGGSPRGRGARRGDDPRGRSSPPPSPLRGGHHRGLRARRWGDPRPRRSPSPPPHRGGRPCSPSRQSRHPTAPAHHGARPAANPPPRAHVRAGALRAHLRHHGPGYQRAGPWRGGRAPTAAAARGEEVEVGAPVLTLENIHRAALPVLDARRRVRGHVWGSHIEGLRECVARGGEEARLYIRAPVLAAQLGAGSVVCLGRPRVLAIVYLNRHRTVIDERLQILAAEEARVENGAVVDEVAPLQEIRVSAEQRKEGLGQRQGANSEELATYHRNQDQGADAEQMLPRQGEDQGADAEGTEPRPDEHLGGDAEQMLPRLGEEQGADAEGPEPRPDGHLGGEAEEPEPPHPDPQAEEDLGAHAEQAPPGEGQQPIEPHEAVDLRKLLHEVYTVMGKKYDCVERLWQEKRRLDREAALLGDWSRSAKAHRACDAEIQKATKVYRQMDEEAGQLRLRLVELGIAPPSPPQRARRDPDHLTPPRQRR